MIERHELLRLFKEMSVKELPADLRGVKAGHRNEQNILTKDETYRNGPFKLFESWYRDACDCPNIKEARAMCLATCTWAGVPSARFVILRGYNKNGFKFFTNYRSRKGKEISENPNASLVFYWDFLKRSIRIDGEIEKLSMEESTQFFYSRPKDYQIEAAFSSQSEPVANRQILSEMLAKFKEKYTDLKSIPKPEHWGGYILKPKTFEFWQEPTDGPNDRIHFKNLTDSDVVDNFHLHKGENYWVYEKF